MRLQIKDTPYYILLMLGFFPLMPYGIISITTIVFVITTIIFYRKNLLTNVKNGNVKSVLINTFFFFLIACTYLYSEDKEIALNELRKTLNFLIFPITLLLFFPKLDQSKINKVFNSFVVSNALLLTYITITIVIYCFSNLHLRSFFSFPFREIIMGKTYLDLHPTYLCLWFAFSMFYIILRFKKKWGKLKKTLMLSLALMFFCLIFLMAARTILVAVVINTIILIFYNKIFIRNTKLLVSVSVILLGVLVFLKNTDVIKYRLSKELEIANIKPPKGRTPKSISIRYGIYSCDYTLFKNKPFLGYGVGDVQTKLNDCYRSFNTSIYKKIKLDSHNYFFYLVLSGGILTLFSFLGMFLNNLATSISKKDFAFFSFLLLIFITCFTENVLTRVHGNFFFSLYSSVFLLKHLNNKPIKD